jgi:hypothetical protein
MNLGSLLIDLALRVIGGGFKIMMRGEQGGGGNEA